MGTDLVSMAHTAHAFLEIYLRDHHAAACAGVALARRIAAREHRSSDGRLMTDVAREIEADLGTLESLMASVGVAPSRAKDRLARLAERAGRLKLNGRLLRHSPLSDVIELETLVVGITGKEALWESLRAVGARPEDELQALIARARRQREVVERCRRTVALRAFASVGRSET